MGLQDLLQPGVGQDIPPAACLGVQAVLFHPSVTGTPTLGLTPAPSAGLSSWKPSGKRAGNEVVLG